jgi:catechol 2,3-dioxygenase-like lactoylglutathione lyase family enzyme
MKSIVRTIVGVGLLVGAARLLQGTASAQPPGRLAGTPAVAQTEFVNLVDHVHLGVPDQSKAVEWYQNHFGGQTMAEGPDRLMFGQTRLIFQKNDMPQPSAGSVLDHIGFSVADLGAAMRSGVKIITPPGFGRNPVIEDPWGTRIEIVQDPQKLGLHHVLLRAPDPAAALAWYVDKFGGKTGKLKDQDGVEYGGIWILAQRGGGVPSAGHAIDHIGFRPVNLDETVGRLKAKSVKVTSEPRALTLPSGTTMHIAFIESPDGVRIELVQR